MKLFRNLFLLLYLSASLVALAQEPSTAQEQAPDEHHLTQAEAKELFRSGIWGREPSNRRAALTGPKY